VKAGKFISNYLKAADIKEAQDVIIRAVVSEKVGMGDKAQNKLIMYFKELEQGVVLNKTNLKWLQAHFKTDETDFWVGNRVGLTTGFVNFQGEMVKGIKLTEPRDQTPTT
jgi:hypothetical protein